MAETVNILALKAGAKRRGQGRRAGQFAGSPLANPHLARFALEIGVEGKHTAQSRLRNLHLLGDSTDLAGLMNRLSMRSIPGAGRDSAFCPVGFAVTSLGSHGIAPCEKEHLKAPFGLRRPGLYCRLSQIEVSHYKFSPLTGQNVLTNMCVGQRSAFRSRRLAIFAPRTCLQYGCGFVRMPSGLLGNRVRFRE